MAVNRSFTEYVAKTFDNQFWAVTEQYLHENMDSLDLELYRIHKAGEPEIAEIKVEHVWVDDLPEMKIQFDVALSVIFEIPEADYHYDNSEEKKIWIMVRCRGDLACSLQDFEIYDVSGYNGKNRTKNPMDDSLVPFIPYEKLDEVANEFLKEYYPEALKITPYGQPPVWVDPNVLTERLGLTIQTQCIREDTSVFGQLYFIDTDTEMYDVNTECNVPVHIDGKTIVVDPKMFLLRNLGSVNNTIVHECVHWVKHRKVFELEKLYNTTASYISCEVVGGAASAIARKSTEFMEKQANQLTPRIQMPADSFRAKTIEYISKFMRETNARHTVDVMEKVITALVTNFGVSRQAAKIRLVELDFEEAIGTYTYLDGHYVKPHSFRKGSIKVNQTFSLSSQDAAIQRFMNAELRALTENGDYLFIDNHFVYNAPLYVERDANGKLDLTGYARSHMDECCLVFDMSITSKVDNTYHTACFLNREPSDITFEIKYHNGFENAPQERQVAMRKKQQAEAMEIRRKMTDDPEQCMKLILDWREMKYTDLGDTIDRDPKTISRTVKGETAPKVETAALICFGLNLPPVISEKLMAVLGCPLNPMNPNHQWINEALHVKYPEPLWAIQEYLSQYGVEI
ncbi:MAG TPA: hypothetical protein VIO64_01605 [Pseudobacteroides sp.]|uniref:ImmA/IrrE family metallo-endopeptidase n=1 Tax=Pseudobacteroides sp. TaxID=1968840 RepID=UPI002F9253A3